MSTKWISKLLCRLGYHGPRLLGNESQMRSENNGILCRKCNVCKTEWHGTVRGWRKVK